jgi:hypothetical protein
MSLDPVCCLLPAAHSLLSCVAGPILQQVLGARLGSSDSTAVRRGLAELLHAEWTRRPELRNALLRAPLLHLLTDPDGEGRCAWS